MSDQAGASIAAIAARQADMAVRHRATTDADRVLTETLASAHEAARDSLRRLDAIAAEIVRVHELAVDTPLGAREFQRFLLAKQHEIATVVTAARDLSRAKGAVLHSLRVHYDQRSAG